MRVLGKLARPAALALLALSMAAPAATGQSVPRQRTLVIAQNFDPQTLWPNGTTASTNLNAGAAIVEPLFWPNPATNKLEPVLALSSRNLGDTSLELKLRPNVQFSNGEPMNADAVIHSIGIITDIKQTPAYARDAGAIDRVEKKDDLTVVIHTKYPYPAMPLVLTSIYVTPPKYWNEVGREAYGHKPVGTGPYVLTEWVKDDRVVMDKNPKYWGKVPEGIDRIVWKPIPDDTARAVGLETGEYDLGVSLSVNSVPRLEAIPDLTLYSVPSYRVYTIILSMLDKHKSPLHDKRVRQALNYAVDKESIVKNLFFGKARILQGQVLREEQLGFAPDVKAFPYDPAKAKALLAEAGYPNGFEVVFKYPSGRYAQDREVSEAVAGMLAKVGVRTKQTVLEPGEFLRQLREQDLGPMAYVGLAPQDDPHFQLSQYRSDWRYTYIKNAELDALIDAGAKELDVEKRAEIYRKTAKLLHEEAPALFLFLGVDFYASTKRLKGLAPTGDQRIYLYGVSLADK